MEWINWTLVSEKPFSQLFPKPENVDEYETNMESIKKSILKKIWNNLDFEKYKLSIKDLIKWANEERDEKEKIIRRETIEDERKRLLEIKKDFTMWSKNKVVKEVPIVESQTIVNDIYNSKFKYENSNALIGLAEYRKIYVKTIQNTEDDTIQKNKDDIVIQVNISIDVECKIFG